jgi:hypothetical protein
MMSARGRPHTWGQGSLDEPRRSSSDAVTVTDFERGPPLAEEPAVRERSGVIRVRLSLDEDTAINTIVTDGEML